MIMVDSFEGSEKESSCQTTLKIRGGNIFCDSSQAFREPGIIEHIAQSAAAYAGFGSYLRGEEPKLGFIGEVKKAHIYALPKVGDELHTHLQVLGTALGTSLLQAEVWSGETKIADTQMKIFIKE